MTNRLSFHMAMSTLMMLVVIALPPSHALGQPAENPGATAHVCGAPPPEAAR